jgi:hypothetical protein
MQTGQPVQRRCPFQSQGDQGRRDQHAELEEAGDVDRRWQVFGHHGVLPRENVIQSSAELDVLEGGWLTISATGSLSVDQVNVSGELSIDWSESIVTSVSLTFSDIEVVGGTLTFDGDPAASLNIGHIEVTAGGEVGGNFGMEGQSTSVAITEIDVSDSSFALYGHDIIIGEVNVSGTATVQLNGATGTSISVTTVNVSEGSFRINGNGTSISVGTVYVGDEESGLVLLYADGGSLSVSTADVDLKTTPSASGPGSAGSRSSPIRDSALARRQLRLPVGRCQRQEEPPVRARREHQLGKRHRECARREAARQRN